MVQILMEYAGAVYIGFSVGVYRISGPARPSGQIMKNYPEPDFFVNH